MNNIMAMFRVIQMAAFVYFYSDAIGSQFWHTVVPIVKPRMRVISKFFCRLKTENLHYRGILQTDAYYRLTHTGEVLLLIL